MKNRIPTLALVAVVLILAVIGCGKVQSPTATVAAVPGQHACVSYVEPDGVAYIFNIKGTIQVLRADADLPAKENMALYDDDQILLVSSDAQFDIESTLADVQAATIKFGDEGYWNAELGTKNPPDPDWARCRACFYTSYY